MTSPDLPVDPLPHESWEKVLPFVGIALTLVLAIEVVVTWLVDDQLGPVLLRVILAEMFPGREAAIPLGLTGHVPEMWLWQITWTVDLAYFSFLYPVFLTVLHRRKGSGGFFMRRIEKLEHAAQQRRRFAQRWGPFGIFLFMMVPFLVNGPLVGMVVGRLAGIHTRHLFFPVLAANLISNGLWVILFDSFFWELRKLSSDLDQYVAMGVFGAMFLAATIGILVDEIKERRQQETSAVAEEE